MTTVGSASSNPLASNPNGHFSSKVDDKAQRFKTVELCMAMDEFHSKSNSSSEEKKAMLDAIYTAVHSGVALPQNPQEHMLASFEAITNFNPVKLLLGLDVNDELPAEFDSLPNPLKDKLKKCKDQNGSHDPDKLYKDLDPADQAGIQEVFNDFKASAHEVFKQNPPLMFEKAAAHPETVRRLVNVIDLPAKMTKAGT